MLIYLFCFCLILGLWQSLTALKGWRSASLSGPHLRVGLLAGLILIAGAGWGLLNVEASFSLLLVAWIGLAVPLSLALLLLIGSLFWEPPHPDTFFSTSHPAHGGCERLTIEDGNHAMPALLVHPLPQNNTGRAVCLVHGAGDSKSGFKWRLVKALIAEGLTVLSIDLPGHGDYRQRPLSYPNCLSAVPAAVNFLRHQRGFEWLGVVGISLGGAMAVTSLVESETDIEALVILETPLLLVYNKKIALREAWQALRSPVMDLLAEMSLHQIWQSWNEGGYISPHRTVELFALFNPAASFSYLPTKLPLLLVYSRKDPIAPAFYGRDIKTGAPQAELMMVNNSSHVTLTLLRPVCQAVGQWLSLL